MRRSTAPRTSSEQAETFRVELERISPVESLNLGHKNWLHGTDLLIKVPSKSWLVVEAAIDDAVQQSSVVHGHWTNPDESLSIVMGMDAWQSTRCDRFTGSRIHNVDNNDPIASLKRLQTVRLERRVQGKKIGHPDYKDEDETMAHILRVSARLSASDITFVLNAFTEPPVDCCGYG